MKLARETTKSPLEVSEFEFHLNRLLLAVHVDARDATPTFNKMKWEALLISLTFLTLTLFQYLCFYSLKRFLIVSVICVVTLHRSHP